ncbi:MAG TPA: hypothetical protein VM889_07030 [Candidatus Thermoplasmatota archaeon]|nr:hypothetical protein [Candidatus Thermoplasmatota archaeon]
MPTHPIARALLLTFVLAVASAVSAAVVTGVCGGSGKDVEDPVGAVAVHWSEGATGCSAWVDRDGDGRPEAGGWVGGTQDPPSVGAGIALADKPGVIGASGGTGLAINEEGVQVQPGGGALLSANAIDHDAMSLGGGGSSLRLGPAGGSGHVAVGEGLAINEEGVQVFGASVGGGLAINEEGVQLAGGGLGGGLAINEEGVQIGSGGGAGLAINEEGVQVIGGGADGSTVRNATADSDADGFAVASGRARMGGASTESSDARNVTIAADGLGTGADLGGSTLVVADDNAAHAAAERSARVPRGVADGTARAATGEGASVEARALGAGATCGVDQSSDPDVACGDD